MKTVIRNEHAMAAIGRDLREMLKAGPVDVELKPHQDKRTVDQNKKLHAMCHDLERQVKWHGSYMPLLKWKRLATAAWLRSEGEQPEMIPALDGNGFDVIFERTSKLNVKQTASLIGWLEWFGADQTPQVQWTPSANEQSLMQSYQEREAA